MRLVAGIFLLGAVAGCAALGEPSRVRAGELYVAGSAKYDAYFGEVHAHQVAAATWPEERKLARKPLLDALKLAAEPDDATLVQLTKDGMGGGALHLEVRGTEAHVVAASAAHRDAPHDLLITGVEQTAQGEIARSKKLRELPRRLDELAMVGHVLEAHLGEDFGGEGHKPFDVRAELHVSYDVLQAISEDAKREQRLADQFISELGRAVATGSEAPAAPPAAPEKEGKGKLRAPSVKPPRAEEPAKPAKPARAEPPPPANASKPSSPPPPPVAPKPPERTEVFSP